MVFGTMGYFVIAYVRTGRRGQNSPLIPKQVEKQIDKLVFWLDQRFGKDWVDRGMDALQLALSSTGPGLLVQLLEPVFKAEVAGRDKHWTGAEKREYAASSVGRN
jgi:hypothetical protein